MYEVRRVPKETKYYESVRQDLVKFIPVGARRVLDVGCGLGLTGAAIKSIRGRDVEVVGIEADPAIGEKARSAINKVFVGDVENIDLPFEKGYFDCILYGDILEHLVNPWDLIKRHSAFLREDGLVIASIPNIAHYRISKMLRRREWNYEDSGILDRTHLRFFTLKSIKDMFAAADFRIKRIERRIGASKMRKALNRLFFNTLRDSMTEQYIVVAGKADKCSGRR